MPGWRLAGWALIGAVVAVYALLPVLWLVWLSVTSIAPGAGPWGNYVALFTGDAEPFARPLLNSVGIALVTTVIAVVCGAMAGYAVARLAFPGKRLLLGAAVLVALVPQLSLVVPVFALERRAGLVDTWPGLIGPYMTFALPVAIFLMAVFFAQLPAGLEEAARRDGATPWQVFRTRVLPVAWPGMGTAAIGVFLFCWNDFVFALSLTSTEAARTAPPALASFVRMERFAAPTGALAAAAVVITVPIVVFVLAFQRRIIAALTAGAVRE